MSTGGLVEYRRGMRGASEWRVLDRAGEPVLELRGDAVQLTAEDVADIQALLERIAGRRSLKLL